jgi:predicted PurR-regulated permease PerM
MANKLSAWLTFAGGVLVVAVLYWAQAILVPIALAILIAFVLSPPVTALQRWMGRVPAVLLVVALVFSALACAGWVLALQMSGLAAELPRYRDNIRQKIVDVRNAGRGGSVEQVQQTFEEIQREIEKADAPGAAARSPIVVQSEPASSIWNFPAWLGPLVAPLSTAGLVIALVIFMLIDREDLRGRLLGLFGHGRLAVTTRALDEAGRRVSRQLLMQTLVNAIYGVTAGTGLWWLGVPYPLLWAVLGALLRFIPYLGPLVAALGPILISLAVLPGWIQPLWVAGLYTVLELFTNLVLETVLYAGAAGVSQVALLIAVAGWTWLWGSVGLLLATPLTVCLVVLGKHLPGLEFLSMLMADSPALAPDVSYYQRLLARDQAEAADLVERYIAQQPADRVYDALFIPALTYAERDRLEGRLSADDERVVFEETRDLLDDATLQPSERRPRDTEETPLTPVDPTSPQVTVFAVAAGGLGDELALSMLTRLLARDRITLDVQSNRLLLSELVTLVAERGIRILCIADLPPSPPSRTRYLVRKLRAAAPDLTILVGRWAPPLFADDAARVLAQAGANHVASTLLDTRALLRELAAHERRRGPIAAESSAVAS